MTDDGSGSSGGVRGGVAEAAHLGDERTTLLGFLQRQRDLVAWKLQGAADADLRAARTPTGMSPLGLVRHLTVVERDWLQVVVLGLAERDADRGWQVPDGVTLADVLEEYAAQTARTDRVVAGRSLDDVTAVGGYTLRWVLLHLVEETARHLGHLDLLREQADGVVGEEP